MPAVSKAQQKFMGMVHAAQKGEKPASKDVKKAADNMSDKSAKDFASTKHKGLPSHVKEGDVTTKPEVPTDDDLDGLPSAAIVGVSAEGITDTQSTSAPSRLEGSSKTRRLATWRAPLKQTQNWND